METHPELADIAAALRRAGCVFAEEEAGLIAEQASSAAHPAAQLAALLARRVAGEPLEQVLGWAEFCGLRVAVQPGVFVPRRRTELLVRLACVLAARSGPPVVVDLCCGSGAIGLAVAARLGGLGEVELTAVDVDPAAVRCARHNLRPVGGVVLLGDLFEPLPRALLGRVGLVLVSPPYVPTGAIALMPPEARLYESATALDGGVDGLAVLRRVVAGVTPWLAPGGHLLAEFSAGQAPAALEVARGGSLAARVVRSEGLDATVLVATHPHP